MIDKKELTDVLSGIVETLAMRTRQEIAELVFSIHTDNLPMPQVKNPEVVTAIYDMIVVAYIQAHVDSDSPEPIVIAGNVVTLVERFLVKLEKYADEEERV